MLKILIVYFVKANLENLFWLFLGLKNTLTDDIIISNTYGPPAITDTANVIWIQLSKNSVSFFSMKTS